MQPIQSSERILPELVYPAHIEAEILKAKVSFTQKYGIDASSGRGAQDQNLDYPVNWWDLMEYELYREMEKINAEHYDSCTGLEMNWQQEDYYNSEKGRQEIEEQKREQEELERYLSKVRAYTGKESLLEENLCIPLIYSMDAFSIKIEVILLAVKFGYPCPLTDEDLSPANCRSGEIEKDHPAFIKYLPELSGVEFIHTANLIEWEYEEAETYLAGFVPKGYYIGIEEDYGWGVFKIGSFDYDGPDY